MSILNVFAPRKIKYPNSKYNKGIVVVDFGTSATLLSEALIESGSIMSHVWGTGIKRLIPKSFKPASILLLGLGGGSNAQLVSKKYPQAKIVGVDIDPVMVELGKKYFGLGKIKNLEIVVDDALNYVNKLKPNDQFDLVLLDCFIGENVPKKLGDPVFLRKLKTHARFVLINRLWWREHKAKTLAFMDFLSAHFVVVKTQTKTNTIISLV